MINKLFPLKLLLLTLLTSTGFLLFGCSLTAYKKGESFDRSASQIPVEKNAENNWDVIPGDRVFVELNNERRFTGKIQNITPDSLLIEVNQVYMENTPKPVKMVTVAADDIVTLTKFRRRYWMRFWGTTFGILTDVSLMVTLVIVTIIYFVDA